jgi:myo-inositol-1(or 4)-monophosphatase
MSRQTELEAAVRIATKAGDLIRRFFVDGDAGCAAKGSLDIVTKADVEAARWIASEIRRTFPEDGLFCEESGQSDGVSGRVWYIDPLDGTKNFAHGVPHFCTMLALEEDGELRLAVIHDPMRRETFRSARGCGAYCNDVRLQVSAIAAPSEAMVASGFPSGKRHRDLDAAPFHRVCAAVQGLRRSGCTGLDLAYVSCGRFDGMWDWGLEKWDLAAGLLLVNEAGGVCSDWDGQPYALGNPGLIAAGPGLHEPLRLLLSRDRHDSDPILDS